MQNIEIYKDISGFEGIYQVSDLGNVKSLRRQRADGIGVIKEKILRAGKNGDGYYHVVLFGKLGKKSYPVHRLVANEFIPKGNPNMNIINHIDHNIENNNVNNLEWTNHRGNAVHGYAHKSKGKKMTGAYYNPKGNRKWFSNIMINKKIKHLGSFNTEIEAHNAYISASFNLKE